MVFFLCASVVGLPFADGRSSERAKTTAPYGDGRRSGAEWGGREGARRDSKQEIAAKSLGGRRASEATEDAHTAEEEAARKKENPEGRKAATHPPSLPRRFCGRSAAAVSLLRAFPSFIRNGPFHSESGTGCGSGTSCPDIPMTRDAVK